VNLASDSEPVILGWFPGNPGSEAMGRMPPPQCTEYKQGERRHHSEHY
jgi:hypothetical protein